MWSFLAVLLNNTNPRSGYIKAHTKLAIQVLQEEELWIFKKILLKEQEKRKKLHPSGQSTCQTLFVPGHPDFHCVHMGMLSWQKSFLAVRQPRRFMVFVCERSFVAIFLPSLGCLCCYKMVSYGNVHFRGCNCTLGDYSVFPETRFTSFLMKITRTWLL